MFWVKFTINNLLGNQYHPDIVVVKDKSHLNPNNDDAKSLDKLQYVPQFYPILKSTIDIKEDHKLFQINAQSVMNIFLIKILIFS